MDTDALSIFLARILDGDPVTVRMFATEMQAAGLLPDDGKPVSLENCIDLMLASLVANVPAGASQAAREMGRVPLSYVQVGEAGANGSVVNVSSITLAEDLPIETGSASDMHELTSSLRGAIAYDVWGASVEASLPRDDEQWMCITPNGLTAPEAMMFRHAQGKDGRNYLQGGVFRLSDQSIYRKARVSISVSVPQAVRLALSEQFATSWPMKLHLEAKEPTQPTGADQR